MAPGPLPTGRARRRNAATIPTKKLPAAGRPGRAPAVPKSYELGPAGKAWWSWAWKQPQAVHWDHGHLYAVARRAHVEDLIAAVDDDEPIALGKLLEEALGRDTNLDDGVVQAVDHVSDRVEALMRGMRAVAGGAAALYRQAGELDKALGLTPKAMADLRWELVKDPAAAAAPEEKKPAGGTVRRLRAVDPAAS